LRPKHEFDVHAIIKCYPYFLGEEFASMRLVHERIYPDRTRADFTFSNKQKVVVVEVKKDAIDITMLIQLIDYLDKEKLQNPQKNLEGLLVGLPSNDLELKKGISESQYCISEKFISIDVPSDVRQIKICAEINCRKANWQYKTFCDYCGSQQFIEDPFIFQKHVRS